jgi:hypothetical protein
VSVATKLLQTYSLIGKVIGNKLTIFTKGDDLMVEQNTKSEVLHEEEIFSEEYWYYLFQLAKNAECEEVS